jgi:hypothetical protein
MTADRAPHESGGPVTSARLLAAFRGTRKKKYK